MTTNTMYYGLKPGTVALHMLEQSATEILKDLIQPAERVREIPGMLSQYGIRDHASAHSCLFIIKECLRTGAMNSTDSTRDIVEPVADLMGTLLIRKEDAL